MKFFQEYKSIKEKCGSKKIQTTTSNHTTKKDGARKQQRWAIARNPMTGKRFTAPVVALP